MGRTCCGSTTYRTRTRAEGSLTSALGSLQRPWVPANSDAREVRTYTSAKLQISTRQYFPPFRIFVVAELLAVKVSVLVPVAGFGRNAAVTPLPWPVVVKLTLPLKPLVGVIVIVAVPCDERVMVKLVGDADREKSAEATAVTVKVTVVVCVTFPPVPVTVIG